MNLTKTISAIAVAGMFAFAGAPVTAAVCPEHSVAAVTGTSGCELGSTNNDFLNPLQVNADNMFGYNDWVFDAKDNDVDGVDEGDDLLDLLLVGTQLGGAWSINPNAPSLYEHVMLVFKGGAGNTDPDKYVGYLLNETSGEYASPFINPNNENRKNISHVSVYVRGIQVEIIPIPAAGFLLIGGLGGLMALRRRKS
ncbi:MAG: VPLPA-CTERM sorting domain-containing protein [Boseongicola sp.]